MVAPTTFPLDVEKTYALTNGSKVIKRITLFVAGDKPQARAWIVLNKTVGVIIPITFKGKYSLLHKLTPQYFKILGEWINAPLTEAEEKGVNAVLEL